jgi:acyl dehydratase
MSCFGVPVEPAGSKKPIWETIEVGEEFGPLETAISDHDVKSYAYAVDDFHPWYLQNSPFDGRVVPPALLPIALFNLWYLTYDRRLVHGLHAREELQLFGPVVVGQQLRLRARVADKFVRRGERYIVVEGHATDDRGKILIRTGQVNILRKDVGNVVGRQTATSSNHLISGVIRDRVPVAASPSADIGAVLPALTKKVTFEQMTVFSFGTRSIHTDHDAALESGLEGPIAQGLMSTCYLSEMLVNFFGAECFETGWTSHAFIRPVSAGDTITVHGTIQDKRAEADGSRLLLEVWCSEMKLPTLQLPTLQYNRAPRGTWLVRSRWPAEFRT